MAITDNYVPVRALGNGVTTNYSGNWQIIAQGYERVYLEDAVTGVQTLQVIGTNYSLVFSDTGFTVTFLSGSIPTSSQYVVIGRDVARDQSDPYKTSVGFQGVVVENSFDKLTAISQDIQEQVDRSPQFPVGTNTSAIQAVLPLPVDQNVPVWDGAAGDMVNIPITNISIVSANIASIITVSANIASVNIVSANLSGSNTIGTVAGISSSVTTVAGISSSVVTVASNTANINTVVANITAIQGAAANAATATAGANTATTQAAAALVSRNAADADVVLTHADVVLTHADVALTHADVVLTHADAVTTGTNAAAAAASAQVAAGSLMGTSTTSNTIATGSKTFTTQTNLAIPATGGNFVVVANTAAPANYFHGQVTSYNTSTGALVVNVLDVGGTGTLASWNIVTSSPQGPTGSGSGTVNTATAGQLTYYAATGTTASGNVNATMNVGALTLGVAGTAQGSVKLSGVTSGTTTLAAASAASGTMTLPSATDTIVGKATTDTFTNKTYDTAGTGNSFKIAGQAITAVSGNTATVATTTGTLTNTHLAVFDASGNIKDGGAVPTPTFSNKFTSSQQNVPSAGTTLTVPHGLGAAPFGVQVELQCITNNLGWLSGDKIVLAPAGMTGTGNNSTQLYYDATNVYVLIGSQNLVIYNKGTGAQALITAADWQIVVKAFV